MSATAPAIATTCATPAIRIEAVTRAYSRGHHEVRALDGVSFRIERGEWVALMGPSGSGKSTLLHVLGLLDTPTTGSYWLDGEEVAGFDDRERTRRRNEKIGFVFQAFHLVPHLSILENVALPLVYRGEPRPERERRSKAALERVGLGHRLSHSSDELSGGEQQRAAIARAIVQEPAVLLADEPTGNLDGDTTASILDVFRQLHGDGHTIVVVTHDPGVGRVTQRTIELRNGRITA